MESKKNLNGTIEEDDSDRYIILLSQLEKSIQAFDSLHKCTKLCKEINENSHKIEKTDFSIFKEKPFQDTNIVIFTCKYGRRDILNYILSEDENILFNMTERIGISAIHPDDQDSEGKNAFYYSMKSPKTDLLELLINKWQQGLTLEQLDKLLSSALKELKLRNVSISTEVEIYVESRLVKFRFYEPTKPNQPKQKRVFNPTPVLQRIDLVLEKIEFVLGSPTPGESFLCALKQIAVSVHVLKRQLRPTYDSIPWEEIEFYLATFIGCDGEPRELSMFHGSALSQRKMLQVLGDLFQSLSFIKSNASSVLTGKFLFPKLTREEMKKSVIQNSSFSEEFYDDFENLRDFVTLETLSKYMRIATEVDAKDYKGKMVLTRCLQVIGEHLKNTVESPKLSLGAADFLLSSLPLHTAEVLKRLRDALSHDHALEVRAELEENTHAFFEMMQKDMQKLAVSVEAIKYRKKESRVRKLLKSVTRCDTVQEMRNLVEAIDITRIQDIIKERSRNVEVDRVESLVHALRSRLKETTNNEDSLFTDIERLLQAEKDKLEGIKTDFAKVHSYLSLIVLLLQGDSESHEIRKWADEAMSLMSSEKSLPYISEVKTLLSNLWNSISPRLGEKVDEVLQISFELSHVLEFDLVSVRWIHEFRDRLDKERGPVQKKKKKVTGLYDHLLTKKTQMLRELLEDNHLMEGRLHETIAEYKKDEKLQALVEMLLLDIMSIFQSNGRLSENPYFLDNPHPLLLGQNLRKHLAHENALVRELADVDTDVLLAANTVVSASNTVDLTDKILKNDPWMLMDTCSVDLKVAVQTQTRLFEALGAGNISLVRECVKNGTDIHGRDLKGRTALYFASNKECARFAAKTGVKPGSCDQFGCTALHSAALNGRADVVTYMIDELEMGVDCRDNFMNTPLHLSAEKGHSAVVKALLERGASTGAVDAGWNTPLHSAVGSGQLQTAKLLLNEEVHADAGRNVGGFTPLHISAEKGFEDLVKYLLDIGAEVNLGTDDGFTALHRACLTGRVEVVKVLLSRGAKVSALSVSGYTPAHLAAKNGHCSVLSLLCQKGCKLKYKDKIDGSTPLHVAAMNGHKDAVKVLLEKGSDVSKKDLSGRTPLHLACFSGSEDIVKKLLESGASVDVGDEVGTTPLHVAVCKNSFEIVRLLLEHGANPNAIHHKRKCSALHIACACGSETIVQLLIERGSYVDAKDGNGETPLTLSFMSRQLDIIATLLMKGGADIHKKNSLGLDAVSLAAIHGLEDVLKQLVSLRVEADQKSLCFACASGNIGAVQFLLGCGLDVNSTALGSTPLHEAARGNHKDLVKLLIGQGADPKSQNQNEFTPMLDAVKLNFKDVVEELLKAGAEVDMDLLMIAVNHGGELMEVLLKDRPVDLKEETILLHAACRAGMKSAADVLLSRGVPVNCVDDKGVPLLLSSVAANQHDIVDYLLSKGADPDAGDPDDQTTPLLAACVSGHVRTVAALIKAGCRVDENVFEMTILNGRLKVIKLLFEEKCIDDALEKRLFRLAVCVGNSDIVKHMANNGIGKGIAHLAALNGHLDLLKFFLNSMCVDVNERTETGETILQYAAYGRHSDLIEPLFNFGAEVDESDAFGSTPAHVAASQGNAPFLKLLLQRGAAHDPLNFRGLTPLRVTEEGLKSVEVVSVLKNTSLLFDAVKKKDLKRTKDLLTKGAVSNASASDGSTPLHLASWKGSRDVVKLLLENGADPNTKGKGGSTPLHYAAKHGHTGVVVALLIGGAQFDPRSASIKTPLNLAKRPSQASDLLDLIHRSFRAVRNGECDEIQELKRSESDWIKAVLRCRDSENRTLVVTAIRHDFPRMNLLKNLIQTDDNVEQIVTTLRAVGDFKRLLSVLQSLFNSRSIAFGPDSPLVLDVREEVALAMHEIGQNNKALSDLKSVLQMRIETVGMGEDILRTQRNVAFMLFLQGKYAESVRVYQTLYRKQLQIFGPVNGDAVRSLLHIAMSTFAMRKYDEAMTKCDELMKVVKIQKDSAYLQALSVQASALQMKKDLDGALVLFKKVHETRKKVLGHGHPETVTSLNNIMSVLNEQSKHLQALTVCKEILDAQSSSELHKPPDILKTFASLGKIFMNLGLHFEAYKTFKTILNRGYQDDDIKESVGVLEVRYAFVFPKGGIEGVLKEPTGVFKQGGDLRQMEAAELRRRDSMGRTALHHCVMTGNEAEARLLLRRGVEVLLADHRDENPLQLATRLGRHNMVEILLRHVRLSSPWVLQS